MAWLHSIACVCTMAIQSCRFSLGGAPCKSCACIASASVCTVARMLHDGLSASFDQCASLDSQDWHDVRLHMGHLQRHTLHISQRASARSVQLNNMFSLANCSQTQKAHGKPTVSCSMSLTNTMNSSDMQSQGSASMRS